MENFKRSIRYQLIEAKDFILKFWMVLIVLNILFYIINNITGSNGTVGLSRGTLELSVVGANLMIIPITLIVYNYVKYYESFPLSISLSMTRKEYFLSSLVDNIFISLIFAVIQGILFRVDPFFIKLIGRIPIYDYSYFNIQTDNIFYLISILFIFFLGFTSFWNLVASINYRIGYKMWLIFVGINMLITALRIEIFDSIFNMIGNIFSPRLGIFQILIILLLIGLFYGLNYLVIKRTDIKRRLV